MNTLEVQRGKRADERLERQEFDAGGSLPQVVDAVGVVFVLNAYPNPHMWWSWKFVGEIEEAVRTHGEDLELMP